MIDNHRDSQLSKPRSNLLAFMLGSALLGAALLLTTIISALVVAETYGASGVLAAVCAFCVCWISGSLALAITLQTTGGPQAISGMFLSMAIRTGLPLAVGVTATLAGCSLMASGLFGLILVHYLVGLVAETWIAVRSISYLSQKATAR